jgi:hypothetical protein
MTQGIGAVHAAFIAVLEEEMAGRGSEKAGRVAVSPLTESIILEEPLACAFYLLRVVATGSLSAPCFRTRLDLVPSNVPSNMART